eukprot:15374041-Alexandrium_andersonii.AAC.1
MTTETVIIDSSPLESPALASFMESEPLPVPEPSAVQPTIQDVEGTVPEIMEPLLGAEGLPNDREGSKPEEGPKFEEEPKPEGPPKPEGEPEGEKSVEPKPEERKPDLEKPEAN